MQRGHFLSERHSLLYTHAQTCTHIHTLSSAEWEGLIVQARGNADTAEDRLSIDPSIDSSTSQPLFSAIPHCLCLFFSFFLNPSLSLLFVLAALQSHIILVSLWSTISSLSVSLLFLLLLSLSLLASFWYFCYALDFTKASPLKGLRFSLSPTIHSVLTKQKCIWKQKAEARARRHKNSNERR